ncbi:MAG: hypothetical protein AB1393_03980 [Candidatus Edwardsbacteria bacterium]
MNRLILLSIVISSFILTSKSPALVIKSGKEVVIGKEEIIDDDLIVSGGNVSVKGTVNGDIFAWGGQVTVDGVVNGDIVAAGGQIRIRGLVNDGVRIAGGNLEIEGKVKGNALCFGGSIQLGKDGEVGRDLWAFGGRVTIDGKVNRSLHAGCGEFAFGGTTQGNVEVKANQLTLLPEAEIKGNLNYQSAQQAEIQAGAKILGETKWQKAEPKTKVKRALNRFKRFFRVALFFSLFLVGIIMIAISKKHARLVVDTLSSSPWKSLGFGILFLLLVPIAVVILLISIIGIPIAIFGIFAYLLALYFGAICFSLAFGEKFLRLFKKEGEISLYLSFILGLILLGILVSIPYLGFLVKLLVMLFGAGIFVLSRQRLLAEAKAKGII